MEEIEKETEEVTELIEEEPPYKKEPRQNYVIYTVISVILFFILYFGVNFVTGKINAEYYMTVDGSQLTDEQKAKIEKYIINPVESRKASLETKNTLKDIYDIPTSVETLDGFIDMEGDELAEFVKKFFISCSLLSNEFFATRLTINPNSTYPQTPFKAFSSFVVTLKTILNLLEVVSRIIVTFLSN